MRPFLPQSRYDFRVLLKWVVVYALTAIVVALLLVAGEFVVSQADDYWEEFDTYGMKGLVDELRVDFGSLDSRFIRSISYIPLLAFFVPIGIGGILGVAHYIFIRRRRSIISMIESSNSKSGA